MHAGVIMSPSPPAQCMGKEIHAQDNSCLENKVLGHVLAHLDNQGAIDMGKRAFLSPVVGNILPHMSTTVRDRVRRSCAGPGSYSS